MTYIIFEVRFEVKCYFCGVVFQKIFLDTCCIIWYNIPINFVKYKENLLLGIYLIFGICMCGCAVHAFYLGRRTGVESTVEYLMDKGILELDEESPSL